MRAIRLESFRCLADTGFVELRPLTLLVGKNSSGKSSFLRFLPLLRQTAEARIAGPLQWFGDYVDFGGFSETVSSLSDDNEIRIGFQLGLDARAILQRMRYSRYAIRRRRSVSDSDEHIPCTLTLGIVSDRKDRSVSRFRSITIAAAGHTIDIHFGTRNRIRDVAINGAHPFANASNTLRTTPGTVLPLVYAEPRRSSTTDVDAQYMVSLYSRPLALAQLVACLREMFHGRSLTSTIAQVAYKAPLGTDSQILASLKGLSDLGRFWSRSVARLPLGSPKFAEIRNLLLANSLGALMQELDSALWAFATGVRYVTPVRASAERYYRQRSLAIDEIDPEGRNLAMFISSLSDDELDDFNAWTTKELGWKVVSPIAGGHISLGIERKGAQSYNLTDVGFGFSQLLPVVAQLWSMRRFSLSRHRSYRRSLLFAIEQPELHLHPSLQARLAEILIRAVRSVDRQTLLSVILETHSEAIVNRVGQQIASGQLQPEDASVVLFDQAGPHGATEVRTAHFDSNGFLDNWPFGFFEP